MLEQLQNVDIIKAAKLDIVSNRDLAGKLGFTEGQNVVVSNLRVVGPLKGSDVFLAEDFDLLQSFEFDRCGYKAHEVIQGMEIPDMAVEGQERAKVSVSTW